MNDERKGLTSASSAEADALCHARHLRQQGLPEMESQAAEKGTRIHAAFAGESIELGPDELDLLQRAQAIESNMVLRWNEDDRPTTCIREERIWACDPLTLREIHSGKPDILYIAGRRALVLDLKTGRGEVSDPSRNLQLRDLAALVWDNLGVNEVAVGIIQPMAPGAADAQLCYYDNIALHRAHGEMIARALRSQQPGAAATPGEAQCKYCKAKATCVEHQQWLGCLVQYALDDANRNSLKVAGRSMTPAIRGEYLAYRAKVRKAATALGSWLHNFDYWVSEHLDQWPEASLVDVPAKRTVVDPVAAARGVEGVLTGQEVMALVKIPITAFEKQFCERWLANNPGGKVKEAKAAFEAAVGPAVEKTRKQVLTFAGQEDALSEGEQ